jgi:hypothetical protein
MVRLEELGKLKQISPHMDLNQRSQPRRVILQPTTLAHDPVMFA